LSKELPAGAHAAPRARGISDLAPALSAAEVAAITAEVALEIAGRLDDETQALRTYKHENPHLEHDKADRKFSAFGMSQRKLGAKGLSRFASAAVTESVRRSHAALDPRNPALREGRSIFVSRIFDANQLDRVLISGINNGKLGKLITKGDWAGSPFYHLSLEERRTCPRSCPVWDACYGNGMPAAVRVRYNANLMRKLDSQLAELNHKHPNGFAVRLHVLGDFPDLDYVKAWIGFSNKYRALQVEGYTAHPRDSEIGQAIWKMNLNRPRRWVIRNSVPMGAPWEPLQVATLWDGANSPPTDMDALVCPQELGKTQTCGTCALCWSPAMSEKRVLFLGHGGRGKVLTKKPPLSP
jgi:hypothetical protein